MARKPSRSQTLVNRIARNLNRNYSQAQKQKQIRHKVKQQNPSERKQAVVLPVED